MLGTWWERLMSGVLRLSRCCEEVGVETGPWGKFLTAVQNVVVVYAACMDGHAHQGPESVYIFSVLEWVVALFFEN